MLVTLFVYCTTGLRGACDTKLPLSLLAVALLTDLGPSNTGYISRAVDGTIISRSVLACSRNADGINPTNGLMPSISTIAVSSPLGDSDPT